jgi:hypothetical protein
MPPGRDPIDASAGKLRRSRNLNGFTACGRHHGVSCADSELAGGGMRNVVSKDRSLAPPDVSEFSRKEAGIWLYLMWQKVTKVDEAMGLNRARHGGSEQIANVLGPFGAVHSKNPAREAALDNVPAWRTFFSITD